MKKIAIDLDKTMFTLSSFLYEILNKLQLIRKKGKLKFKEINFDDVKGVNPILKRLHKAFNPACYNAFPLAIETINSLHEAGYEIYFLSNRPNIAPIVNATVAWLRDNNVHCDKLVLGCNDKAEYARLNGIDMIIDDLAINCKKSEEKGVKSILFKGGLKNPKKFLKLYKNYPQATILDSWSKIGNYVKKSFKEEDKFRNGDLDIISSEQEQKLQF